MRLNYALKNVDQSIWLHELLSIGLFPHSQKNNDAILAIISFVAYMSNKSVEIILRILIIVECYYWRIKHLIKDGKLNAITVLWIIEEFPWVVDHEINHLTSKQMLELKLSCCLFIIVDICNLLCSFTYLLSIPIQAYFGRIFIKPPLHIFTHILLKWFV